MLPSLFDFRPELYGLPPFEDAICGEVVPIQPPWRIKGTVVKGFGRGSRELGIPTANLDCESLQVWTSQGHTASVVAIFVTESWVSLLRICMQTAQHTRMPCLR